MSDEVGKTSGGPSRIVRGALMLLLVGVAVGAALGWTSGGVLYRAEALLYIEAPLAGTVQPRFHAFVEAQCAVLRSGRLANLALQTEPWKETGKPHAAEAFSAAVRVEHAARTQHILVAFLAAEPPMALAGVRALLAAYEQLLPGLNGRAERTARVRAQIEVLRAKAQSLAEESATLTAEYGGAEVLRLRHQDALKRMLALEDELERVRELIRKGANTRGSIEELKARERRLVAQLEVLRKVVQKLAETQAAVERLEAERAEVLRELEQLTALLERLEEQGAGEGGIRIVDTGSLPTELHEDRRLAGAVRWAAVGALPGFLLVLLLVLFRRRANRSRD